MKYFLPLILMLPYLSGIAQQDNKIDYKHLGISFVIPDQWIGQETEGGFIMGSNNIPGMIIMLPHDKRYSIEELTTMAREGMNEGNGTTLILERSLEPHGPDAIGGNFNGTLNYEQVKAYLIGVVNRFGNGVTILALTSPEQYNENYKTYALSVKNSIKFYEPEIGPIVDEWKQILNNMKLTFMESYNSYSSTGGGGYSIKREIELCTEGYFNFRSNSSMSITGTGSTAYSHGGNKGNGSWEIKVDTGGNPILRLHYYNGEYTDYPLAYKDEKLYLNGERYFRTNDSGCY